MSENRRRASEAEVRGTTFTWDTQVLEIMQPGLGNNCSMSFGNGRCYPSVPA
jgi:hypothetical protein